jgi:hypothetical protein
MINQPIFLIYCSIFMVYHLIFFNFLNNINFFKKELKSNQLVFSELTKIVQTSFVSFHKKMTSFHQHCNPYNEPKKENVPLFVSFYLSRKKR